MNRRGRGRRGGARDEEQPVEVSTLTRTMFSAHSSLQSLEEYLKQQLKAERTANILTRDLERDLADAKCPALFLAVKNRRLDIVRLLVHPDFDRVTTNKQVEKVRDPRLLPKSACRITPLALAVKSHHTEMVRQLLTHPDALQDPQLRCIPFHQYDPNAPRWVDFGAQSRMLHPLFLACVSKNVHMVRLLLTHESLNLGSAQMLEWHPRFEWDVEVEPVQTVLHNTAPPLYDWNRHNTKDGRYRSHMRNRTGERRIAEAVSLVHGCAMDTQGIKKENLEQREVEIGNILTEYAADPKAWRAANLAALWPVEEVFEGSFVATFPLVLRDLIYEYTELSLAVFRGRALGKPWPGDPLKKKVVQHRLVAVEKNNDTQQKKLEQKAEAVKLGASSGGWAAVVRIASSNPPAKSMPPAPQKQQNQPHGEIPIQKVQAVQQPQSQTVNAGKTNNRAAATSSWGKGKPSILPVPDVTSNPTQMKPTAGTTTATITSTGATATTTTTTLVTSTTSTITTTPSTTTITSGTTRMNILSGSKSSGDNKLMKRKRGGLNFHTIAQRLAFIRPGLTRTPTPCLFGWACHMRRHKHGKQQHLRDFSHDLNSPLHCNLDNCPRGKAHMMLFHNKKVRPDCIDFVRDQSCRWGKDCRYNHPASGGKIPLCNEFALRGACKNGDACKFKHGMDDKRSRIAGSARGKSQGTRGSARGKSDGSSGSTSEKRGDTDRFGGDKRGRGGDRNAAGGGRGRDRNAAGRGRGGDRNAAGHGRGGDSNAAGGGRGGDSNAAGRGRGGDGFDGWSRPTRGRGGVYNDF